MDLRAAAELEAIPYPYQRWDDTDDRARVGQQWYRATSLVPLQRLLPTTWLTHLKQHIRCPHIRTNHFPILSSM